MNGDQREEWFEVNARILACQDSPDSLVLVKDLGAQDEFNPAVTPSFEDSGW